MFELPLPRLDQRDKLHKESSSRELRLLSREVVLKRLTVPRVRTSSFVIDLLGVSIEGVGVKVWEEEPELEVEKRLKGRRRDI